MKVKRTLRIATQSVAFLVCSAYLATTPIVTPLSAQEQAHEASASAEDSSDSTAEPDSSAVANEAIDRYLSGDVEGAYQLFENSYKLNPDSDPPGVLVALLHSHAGRFAEMRASLEQTAEDYPSDPEAYLQLANVDVQERRLLEAELLLERADSLIETYGQLRPESKARATYLKEEALTTRAMLAEKRGRYDVAAEFTRKSIELNPKNPQAFWNLGYLAMKQGDYDAAEEAYQKASELNKDLWPGWLQTLSALDREDKVSVAKGRVAGYSQKIEECSAKERAQLARLYLRWSMVEEASAIIKEFDERNEARELDRWLLDGLLALYASDYNAAEQAYRKAVLIAPENFEATNGLALALLDQGNREKLVQALQIAARNYRANSDNQEAAATYAWALFLSGRTQEADAIFQPMLSSGMALATIAYYLAEIANLRGDKDLSRDLLSLALSQEANYPKRTAALELMEILDNPNQEQEQEQSPLDDFEADPFNEEESEQ